MTLRAPNPPEFGQPRWRRLGSSRKFLLPIAEVLCDRTIQNLDSGVAPANQTKERAKTKSSWISPIFVNSGVFPQENKRDSHWTFVPECPREKFMNWPFFVLVCRGDSWLILACTPWEPECTVHQSPNPPKLAQPRLSRSNGGHGWGTNLGAFVATWLVLPRCEATKLCVGVFDLCHFAPLKRGCANSGGFGAR